MASFAAAERQITESLVALAAEHPSIQLPHLVGQRFKALATACSQLGEVAASTALVDWHVHDGLRAFLCHGVAKITLARDGSWQAIFHLAALKSGKLQRSVLIVDQAEAEQIAHSLHRDRQRLEARLKPLAAVACNGTQGLRIAVLP